MLVYLAALRQLLGNTVYTRCNRLLELSSLLSGSLLQRQFIYRMRVFCFIFCTVLVCVCVFYVFCLYFMLLPSGVIKIIII